MKVNISGKIRFYLFFIVKMMPGNNLVTSNHRASHWLKQKKLNTTMFTEKTNAYLYQIAQMFIKQATFENVLLSDWILPFQSENI